VITRVSTFRRGRGRRSLSGASLWGRVRPLAVDLLEDLCGYIVLIFFIIASVIITHLAIIIVVAIVGEIPTVLVYGIWLGDASLLLRFISHMRSIMQ
jgi:hypothetical protein